MSTNLLMLTNPTTNIDSLSVRARLDASCMMETKRPTMISEEDHKRLKRLLFSDTTTALGDESYIRSLENKLEFARIVRPDQIPSDVVTMNSTVELRSVHKLEVETYTLVYPDQADIANGKLSVLAPIGTAILGHRVADRVIWSVPRGVIRFDIEALVYQPERSGLRA